MRKSRFTPERILAALRQAEGGRPVADVIRKLGITEALFCRWKKQYAGLEVGELRELKTLRDENAKLRQVVTVLALDKTILKDTLLNNGESTAAKGRGVVGPGDRAAEPAAGMPGVGRAAQSRALRLAEAAGGAPAASLRQLATECVAFGASRVLKN